MLKSAKTLKRKKRHTKLAMIRKANKKRPPSSLELLVYSWLDEAKIDYIKEFKISRCHLDIYFPQINIGLELNGCWFHRSICCYPEQTKENKRIRLKDSKRYAFFRSRGYTIIVLNECQTKKPHIEETKKKLIDQIKKLHK